MSIPGNAGRSCINIISKETAIAFIRELIQTNQVARSSSSSQSNNGCGNGFVVLKELATIDILFTVLIATVDTRQVSAVLFSTSTTPFNNFSNFPEKFKT